MEPKAKERLEEFLHRREILKELRRIAREGRKSLVIAFDRLLEFDMELAKSLLDNPVDFLDAAEEILGGITKLPGMHLRVRGLDKSTEIRKIRAEHVGKFIQVEGILTRAGEVKPELKKAVFKCRRCGEENRILQTGDFFREPFICENPNCGKKGPFDLVIENSEFRDWQSLRIQEKSRGKWMSHQLDCIVCDDLADNKIMLGNYVAITGALRIFYGRQQKTVSKILFVNCITVLQKGVDETKLSSEEETQIKEFAKDPCVRNLIIQSIAPSIYGYGSIKEAIALQLFGCNSVSLSSGTMSRSDIHVLLLGDIGVPKLQLLKWAARAAYGFYISSKKRMTACLTARVVRDEIDGGRTLEAGAFVIADGGLVCIDEFDEMNQEDKEAISEVLKHQSINVAEVGFPARLNARTAVLVAAKPIWGRFDRQSPFAGQVDLSQEILSCFDLIFIMRDEPHIEMDRRVAHYMLEVHRDPNRVVKPPLDLDFLRKIIIYARKNLDPKFEDKKVMKTIEDFFVEWRKVAKREEAPFPVTVRQLEALVRLAKANARLRLSDRVTTEDVNCAIKLVKLSLQEAGIVWINKWG